MRKLLTIDNTPAAKSAVVMDVCKILGKSAFWSFVGYVTFVAAISAFGASAIKKIEAENALKEENNS
jgi:hypothetical protein